MKEGFIYNYASFIDFSGKALLSFFTFAIEEIVLHFPIISFHFLFL